jgi:predicted lipoprotein with Yx(FWY)xxD motif
MTRWRLIGLVGIGLVALAAVGYWALQPRRDHGEALVAPLATPPGITLHATRRGGRAEAFGTPATILFTDAGGKTLYGFEKETPGTSTCTGDCAKVWTPAVAPANAVAEGVWSMIARPDGVRQWVFKNHPLYIFGGDTALGDTKGDSAEDARHAAQFQPAKDATLPLGIGLRELPNGGGQAFVDDHGMTLYAGDCTDKCTGHWKPVPAPEIANRVGDFSVVARHDGIRQWAYQGRPLYLFDGDLMPDDANGAGFDPKIQVALLLRYFMPADVSVRHTAALGDILATREGMTLYARDRFIDADGHNFRTDHGTEATGRALGTMACDVECLKTWKPLVAPADAMASGYWDIFVRSDGARQWAYKGYALYSYAGDHKAGDTNGNESYALMPLGQTDTYETAIASAGASAGGTGAPRAGAGVGAMFWRAATP